MTYREAVDPSSRVVDMQQKLREDGCYKPGLYTVRMVITAKTVGQWLLLAMLATVLYFCFRIMQRFLI